jgi:hypothetical protein
MQLFAFPSRPIRPTVADVFGVSKLVARRDGLRQQTFGLLIVMILAMSNVDCGNEMIPSNQPRRLPPIPIKR